MDKSPSVAFITLGCAKNEVDTNKMKALLGNANYRLVSSPAEADLTIVNTCSFLAAAVEEGIDVIFDALEQAGLREMPGKVLVAGCMPSRYGADLENELTEVAGFLPAAEEGNVVEVVDRILGCTSTASKGFNRIADGPSAYVKISDGCDRFCSYCMIPYIRGRYHSFPYSDIEAEVSELASQGVHEIVLIGQDTGIWGRDFEAPSSTYELLDKLSAAFPEQWFRLLYIQPEGITDELLQLMSERENVCAYIDIPMQHVNADILKRMNRKSSRLEIEKQLRHIREVAPNVVIRTTLMAGFPGETEEQFDELLGFVDEGLFEFAGVFAYSREEGSAAAKFDDQVDEDVKMARAQALLDACEASGFKKMRDMVGKRARVVVEGFEQTDVGLEALGRWQGQAPEVDGQVHIPLGSGETLEIGDIVSVEFIDSFCYELVGERL